MAEITGQAARMNYHSGSSYLNGPEAGYDDRYEGWFVSSMSLGVAIYDGYSFAGLSNNTTIKSIKFTGYYKRDASGSSNRTYFSFYLVKDYYNGSTTSSSNNGYTAIGNENVIVQEQYDVKDNDFTAFEYVLDENSPEVIWANNNINQVNSGTNFGLRIRGRKCHFKIFRLVLVLDDGSKIYIGSNQAKAVYVGGTQAKAVYIGSTKIL